MKKEIDNNIDDVQKTEQMIPELKGSRRTFIKKAVYVAPTLIVLGSLSRPTSADGFDLPPSLTEAP